MAADNIMTEPHDVRLLGLRSLVLAWSAVLVALSLLFAAIAVLGRASDGEPAVTLSLSLPTADVAASGAGAPLERLRPPPVANVTAPPASPAAAISSPSWSVSKPVFAGRALVADPALIEPTDAGPLPRIGPDGRTPMAAYAPSPASDSGRKIAIVITGLGMSTRTTEAALATLPPAVTLAFAPYADDLQHWVSLARMKGHEVLLEIPMEPYDYPDSDPGPHTLLADEKEETNVSSLSWSLARLTGYAGVTNLLGGRFLADPDSLAPVMTFVARRGLFFFDTDPEHNAAPDVAAQVGMPYAQSELTIDAVEAGPEIDARLSDLESHARSDGSAAGVGSAYPITVQRIAAWTAGLAGRGFVLVPASAIVTPQR
jgi:uncharacterized protein